VDVVISPAAAHLPFATAMNAPPDTGVKSWTEWTGFSYPLNLIGQPECVVSCGFSATGLPIGIQIIGARGADGRVLSVAKEIESLIGRYCESNHDLPRDGTRRNCKGPNCRRVEVPMGDLLQVPSIRRSMCSTLIAWKIKPSSLSGESYRMSSIVAIRRSASISPSSCSRQRRDN